MLRGAEVVRDIQPGTAPSERIEPRREKDEDDKRRRGTGTSGARGSASCRHVLSGRPDASVGWAWHELARVSNTSESMTGHSDVETRGRDFALGMGQSKEVKSVRNEM
jgi:hypothetical protein